MDAFSKIPPTWTKDAIHSLDFLCPSCKKSVENVIKVWLNRQAPVMGENYEKKWQEFYQCQCETSWWAWSSDRPASKHKNKNIDS